MSNCILITIDCLRPDFLSCYGYKCFTSPNIDQLAHEGILFTSAFANGVGTPAAFPAILASIYPTMCGHSLGVWNHLTISEVLKRKGYVTAAIHSNPYLSKYFGYNKGFDWFYDLVPEKREKVVLKLLSILKTLLFSETFSNATSTLIQFFAPILSRKRLSPYSDADQVTRIALEWIKKHQKESFFLWLHYMDLHTPHKYIQLIKHIDDITEKDVILVNLMYSNPKFINKNNILKLKRIYESELRFVDAMIGIIIRQLNRLGIFKKTNIIITSDHGEEFLEHGKLGHDPRLYDELIHIPLIIYSPELDNVKKRIIPDLCSQIDIPVTIIDLLKEQKEKSFLGQSLIPLILDKEYDKNKYIISEAPTKPNEVKINLQTRKISLRTAQWKFIWNANGQHELYNLSIGEHENLINKEINKTRSLKKIILKHIRWEEKERIRAIIRGIKRKFLLEV